MISGGGADLENQRIVAIFIAVIAAMLVILAGRSCATSIDNTNKKGAKSSKASYNSFTSNSVVPGNSTGSDIHESKENPEYTTSASAGVEYVTDILGRVIETVTVAQETGNNEALTDVSKEYSTDILGRVIEEKEVIVTAAEPAGQPRIEYTTDILGRVVSTKYVDENGQEVTTQLSSGLNPLDEYREKHPEYYKTTEGSDSDKGSEKPSSTIHIQIG